MKKQLKLALAAATSALLLAGCSDFLKGPGLNTNPNVPTYASPDQLYTAATVAIMAQWENNTFMNFFLWAQQISGVNRQWQTYANFAGGTDQVYADGAWNQTYGPGGLLDLRKVDSAEAIIGNTIFIGQSKMLEALYMGTAADIWGDIPYSTALTAIPTFDPQAQVYTEVQATLDTAIADLTSAPSNTNKGSQADLFLGNDYTKWVAVAHTLKARFYMHTARASGAYNNAILDSVIKYASIGILDTSGNLSTKHTGTPGEQNLFFNFLISRKGDVAPAQRHMDEIILAQEQDSLLPFYYKPDKSNNFIGSLPNAQGVGTAAFNVATTTPVPIVTYVENQMLLAEANLIKGTGNPQNILNAYRATVGTFPPVGSSGAALHQAIIREKYIHLFFNIEVWDDYMRTCYPNVPMVVNMQSAGGSVNPYVPGRLPVGQTEQQANPNVPAQPTGNPANANNPKNALDLVGAQCLGQKDRPGT